MTTPMLALVLALAVLLGIVIFRLKAIRVARGPLFLPSPQPSEGILSLPSGRRFHFALDPPGNSPRQRPETFVLIHGLGDDLSVWDSVASQLKEDGFGVLRADLGGHGKTLRDQMSRSQVPEEIRFEDQTEDLCELIQRLRLQNIHLVGHSYGGGIVLEAATRKSVQSRILSIHLLAPYVIRLDEYARHAFQKKMFGFFGIPTPAFLNRIDRAPSTIENPVLTHFMETQYRDHFLRKRGLLASRLSSDEQSLLDAQVHCAIAATRGIMPLDTRKTVENIPESIPIGMIIGDTDPLTPPDLELELFHVIQKRPSHLGLHFIRGAGHYLPEEAPEWVTAKILECVNSLGADFRVDEAANPLR